MNRLKRSITAINMSKGLISFAVVLMAITGLESRCPAKEASLRSKLDFPILFTKRGNYQGIHIYDTCYQWHPGGGIYILENPSDPPEKHRVRAVIDEHTAETLGHGMY